MRELWISAIEAVGAWSRPLLVALKKLISRGVSVLKRGIKAQKTRIRIGELRAERLKAIPNYVVLDVARKHFRLAFEGILLISIAINLLFAFKLTELADRLSQKRIALVPSRLDVTTEVDVGKIGERQVHATLVMYLSLLGTVDGTNIDENYRILKEFMAPELKVQFERETREFRQMVKTEGVSEQMLVSTKRVQIGDDGQIDADAIVKIRPSIGATFGKIREEKVSVKMRVVTNFEKNQWLLQITELSRRPVDSGARGEGGRN